MRRLCKECRCAFLFVFSLGKCVRGLKALSAFLFLHKQDTRPGENDSMAALSGAPRLQPTGSVNSPYIAMQKEQAFSTLFGTCVI